MGTETIPKTEDATPAEAPSSTELLIIRQIEYYFGNYNLSRDKFLREQLKVDDGWVPLETMVKFNRLKKLSEDFNVIIEALKKSPKQLIEISEDSQKIRRRTAAPLPENYRKPDELDRRTLYVKGFKKNNTLDELLDFFREYNVEHIFMKKHMHQNSRPFKGSVFATFETREDAEKFLETKGIKYNGTEVLKEWKVDYMKRKDEYYDNIRAEKEKKMLKKAENEQEKEEKVPDIEVIPGCLLKLSPLGEDTTREDIKEVFDPHGGLVYLDYSKGKPTAVLRFEEGKASSVREKVLGDSVKVKIGSSEATMSLIEGDEEKEYWKNIAKLRAQTRQKFNKGNRNFGNKKKFKKWGGGRQKRRDDEKNDESDEPPKKRTKNESVEENKNDSAMEVNADTTKNEVNSKVESNS